ncbi:hypothetical protein [Terricaulis sp.]|uniref:hypothetical protein n=1 Tax=Terricaulis sp. TaxID=2768686 RepID=UPI003783CDB7
MAQTKFSAGARLRVLRGVAFGSPTGVVSVVTALPRDAGPQQYRVRVDGESFERIVDESKLEAVAHE